MQAKLQLGLLAFPDMEVLDFAGPFEVFSVAQSAIRLQPTRYPSDWIG